MKKRWLILFFAAIFCCFFCLPDTAAAEKLITKDLSKESMGVRTQISKEQMATAKPYLLKKKSGTVPELNAIEMESNAGPTLATPAGKPGSAAMGAAIDSMTEILSPISPLDSGPVTMAGYSYPPPHTTAYLRSELNKAYPFVATGKMYFKDKYGTSYFCSFAAFGPNAVITAGHCAGEDGVFHTNFTFVPGTVNGSAPYGTWTAKLVKTYSSWLNQGQLGRDVAVFIINPKSGRSMTYYTGYFGTLSNASRTKHWDAFGYSCGSYSCKKPVRTGASLSRTDSSVSPATNGIGTGQTNGSSGGPWVVNLDTQNYINGVFIYYYAAKPKEAFSPYFDLSVYNSLILWGIAQ